MGDYLLVIDEGTTSTRAMLFAPDGKCHGTEQAELVQHYPAPGLVEHDAAEIWEKSRACAQALASFNERIVFLATVFLLQVKIST